MSGDHADPSQLCQGPSPADSPGAELRGLGRQSVRSSPLRDLLQDLHGEGLGDADRHDFGRLGGSANQGARPDPCHSRRLSAAAIRRGVNQDPDRLFPVPRLGPGQMWEAARDKIRAQGGSVHLDRRVVGVEHDGEAVRAFIVRDAVGRSTRYEGKHFLSTLSIRELIRCLDPPPPPAVIEAAESLKYRDFLTVVLIVDIPETFPDTWIYIHEPDVQLGRVQNFKNWSPDMVPDTSKSSLGLEYFCFEEDSLWSKPDRELIEQGCREIEAIGLIAADKVIDGCVVRMPKAYPVYDDAYQDHLHVIRDWLERLENLQLVGRNGMHKYNNQDHSMMTALLAARNILGQGPFDPWKVNTDAEYHEGASDIVARTVPMRVR